MPSLMASIAKRFAYRIEMLEDGAVLFDVSGLHNRIGTPEKIADAIRLEMEAQNISGSIAVAANAKTAELYARSKKGVTVVGDDGGQGQPLPLQALDLDRNTLNVFHALGIENTADLQGVPENELVARYGPGFRKTVDLINQNGVHVLTPNLREKTVAWDHQLDFPVDDFERLIFILGHGLSKVLEETGKFGFSSEQIDITLELDDRSEAKYSVTLAFPTMEKSFWMKLISLRISNDPPPAEIVSIRLLCYFARPRSIQRGLYAAAKPEPESLLLTIDKIKKVVGKDNVGVPVLIDQRIPEPFRLDGEKMPTGKELKERPDPHPVLALTYFHPPLAADITVFQGRLMHLKTRYFTGRVIEHGGIWKESSQWWTLKFWQKAEWDVELENKRIYRLARYSGNWLVTGVYD